MPPCVILDPIQPEMSGNSNIVCQNAGAYVQHNAPVELSYISAQNDEFALSNHLQGKMIRSLWG